MALTDPQPFQKPQIRELPLATLKPAPYNPRQIDDAALAGLTKSLERFGYVEPIIWNERTGYVVGGHQRLKVLKSKNVESVPVVVVSLDETDEKALNVALNSPHISGHFIEDQLQGLLDEIRASDANLFEDIRLDALLKSQPEPALIVDPDEFVVAPPADPVTRPGDMWAMDRHRLFCGDSRKTEDVLRLVGDRKMNLVITSPPYAAQRDYDKSSGFEKIPPDEYPEWFDAVADGIKRILSPDGSFFLNIKENVDKDGDLVLYVKDLVLRLKRVVGFRFIDEFVWYHSGTPKAVRRRFKNGFEPIFQFTTAYDFKFRPEAVRHPTDSAVDWLGKHPSQRDGTVNTTLIERHKAKQKISTSAAQGKSYRETGNPSQLAPPRKVVGTPGGAFLAENQGSGRIPPAYAEGLDLAYPCNVISVGHNREALGHGAMFPVGLPEFFIQAYSDAGDAVYDPFCGAGTTIVACERNERIGYGMEISPAYCDIIVNRWEKLTGKKAVLHREA